MRIDGLLVGYLSREDARAYQPGVLRLMRAHPEAPLIALHGVIVGGGQRDHGIGYLGVFLDHDPTDFGLPPQHVSQGGMRTGRTAEADRERAEMAWIGELPKDDHAAVTCLRELLKTRKSPVSRHFMFCELERRLYRLRSDHSSCLEEFDEACELHHREMDAMRPALIDHLGGVPVLTTYRQAAIRWQKAHAWEDARAWAQRGIDVYGDQPLRPEARDDLSHRAAYASGKLAAQSNPVLANRGSVVVTTTATIGRVETLICAECGQSFDRVVVRGRKPSRCPRCAHPEHVPAT